MKTKNAVLTLAAMIVVSAFTFAAEPTSKVAVLKQSNSGIFKVIYEGATAGKVTLKVYDKNNNLLISETTKGLSKFMMPLNFNGLEQGEYSVEITDENGTQVQKIAYQVESKSVESVHITKLQAEGKYLMSVAGSKGTINVQIFDGNDNLIHSENLMLNGNLGLVYNLKGVQGQPTFQVR